MSTHDLYSSKPDTIVGIGASAGGVEALRDILPAFTVDGAAFVVVTHQGADRASHLPDVLQHFTVLSVDGAHSGQQLQANHIYVLPRSEHFAICGDRLVHERGPWRRSRNIDHFFFSLAASRGADAVGVVLSGANEDGTAGLAAIHAAGGGTFVQDPVTALFARMPASAEGSAEYSPNPRELGKQLMRILNSGKLRERN